ncbi:hypothetical protein C8R47DRAFT_1209098 [Mycena vitilis]|nr:hypothetical protein C8R47DRAFT_1209098 [Mycena vitilis]
MTPNPPDKVPNKVSIHAFFLDRHHPLRQTPNLILEEDATAFWAKQVWEVLHDVQTQHRKDCIHTPCDSCQSLGAIVVKSGWLLDHIPNAATFNANLSTNENQSLFHGSAIAKYLKPDRSPNLAILLLECAFDATEPSPPFQIASGAQKRKGSDLHNEATGKKPYSDWPSRQGICVIHSLKDPTAPLSLLTPGLPFSVWQQRHGVAWVDKTAFISVIDVWLESARINMKGLTIILPSGTGKTAILWMLYAWYDITPDWGTYRAMFANTAIIALAEQQTTGSFWSGKKCLCLMFDLAEVQITHQGFIMCQFNVYLEKVLQEFVTKYQARLGADFILPLDQSPEDMVGLILDRVLQQQLKLFIGVDHWDAPILRSLGVSRTVGEFLLALTGSGKQNGVAKLLIIGNLPLFALDAKLTDNIAWHQNMEGAFGISGDETKNLFSVLSHNRHAKLDEDISDKYHYRTFGAILPPCPHPPPDPVPSVVAPVHGAAVPTLASLAPAPAPAPPNFFNFNLVLNFVARKLDIESGHKTLADSLWLPDISRRCERLLRYSTLRRLRTLPIKPKPIKEFCLASLLAHDKNEQHLQVLLIYLGPLTAHPSGDKILLRVTSRFAFEQLFALFPAFKDSKESTRAIQLKALLERSPERFMTALEDILRRKHLLDLYKMDEAVFQSILEGFVLGVDQKLVADAAEDIEDLKYTENCFPQVHLLTNASLANGEVAVDDSSFGGLFSAGRKKWGYLDLFICGLLELHPGRAIAIEAKCVSLHMLFRAIYRCDKECHDHVYGVGKSTFFERCEAKLKELDDLSDEELLDLPIHFYSTKPGGKAQSNYVKIRDLLKAGMKQLQIYMQSIANGKAYIMDYGSKMEGISQFEKRVKVSLAVGFPPVDELIGYVVCPVGRRIIVWEVKPLEHCQNRLYRYTGV